MLALVIDLCTLFEPGLSLYNGYGITLLYLLLLVPPFHTEFE